MKKSLLIILIIGISFLISGLSYTDNESKKDSKAEVKADIIVQPKSMYMDKDDIKDFTIMMKIPENLF